MNLKIVKKSLIFSAIGHRSSFQLRFPGLLTFASGAFAIELEKLKLKLAESDKTNDDLRKLNANLVKERDKALADLKMKDIILKKNAESIALLEARQMSQDASSSVPLSSNRNGFHNTDKQSSDTSSGHAPKA